MSKKVAVLGGGIAGLSAASIMALNGFDVSLFEKNAEVGGRASKFEKDGFSFDMGPTWYWMPDIIEDFFQIFEGSAADHYELQRLDPSYRVFFGKNDFIDIPSSVDEIAGLFESLEKGAGASLRKYLREAEYKYTVGLKKFAFKPGLSILEFLDWRLMSSIFKLHMLKPFSSYVKKHFKHPYLIQLIEFHVLFLGAKPQNTPDQIDPSFVLLWRTSSNLHFLCCQVCCYPARYNSGGDSRSWYGQLARKIQIFQLFTLDFRFKN